MFRVWGSLVCGVGLGRNISKGRRYGVLVDLRVQGSRYRGCDGHQFDAYVEGQGFRMYLEVTKGALFVCACWLVVPIEMGAHSFVVFATNGFSSMPVLRMNHGRTFLGWERFRATGERVVHVAVAGACASLVLPSRVKKCWGAC